MAENIIGNKYNRLTVLTQYYKFDGKRNRLFCLCVCDCGTEVDVRYDAVKSGETMSCGCSQIDSVKKSNKYIISNEGFIIGLLNGTGNEFYIDFDDFDVVREIGWHEDKAGYIRGRDGQSGIKLHRLIMGFPDGYYVDHINRDKKDCRKENLRIVNPTESARNKNVLRNNKSGITGVCYNKSKNKYVSYIYFNKTKIELGSYKTLFEATVARLKAEKLYFKEFSPQLHLFEEYGIT